MLKKIEGYLVVTFFVLLSFSQNALAGKQPCYCGGDQVSYGDGEWIGYVYYNPLSASNNPIDYRGYVLEKEKFDRNFGGLAWDRPDCLGIITVDFFIRYKMKKDFPAGKYVFTIGGDDGYRFSIDGGQTWLISDWKDHGYKTSSTTEIHLDGTAELVIEYYQRALGARVSFTYEFDASPLPVEMISFSVDCKKDNALIQWLTASETNSDYFSLEGSRDGYEWNSVAQVQAAGNKQTKSYYEVSEELGKHAYYRLFQVDFDGKETLYGPISSECFVEKSEIHLFPNPATTDFTVKISSIFTTEESYITVRDMTGKIVISRPIQLHSGINNNYLIADRLEKGMYIVYIEGEGKENFKPERLIIK